MAPDRQGAQGFPGGGAKRVSPAAKVRHWFWHIVALAYCGDFQNVHEFTEEENSAYKEFMGLHGFSDAT